MIEYKYLLSMFEHKQLKELHESLQGCSDNQLASVLGDAYQYDQLLEISNAIYDPELLYRMYVLLSWCDDAPKLWYRARKLDDQENSWLYWYLSSIISSNNVHAFAIMLNQPDALHLLQTKYTNGSLLDMAGETAIFHNKLIEFGLVQFKIIREDEEFVQEEVHVDAAKPAGQNITDVLSAKALELFKYLNSIEYRANVENFLKTTVKEFLDERFKDDVTTKKFAVTSIGLFAAAAYLVNDCNPIKSIIVGAALFSSVYMVHTFRVLIYIKQD